MLSPASGFRGLSIAALDGDIRTIRDLYFDDITWTIRYLVVDTGSWLPGRQVISPLSVRGEVLADKVPVNLSRELVKNSPPMAADKPVDRQQEEALAALEGIAAIERRGIRAVFEKRFTATMMARAYLDVYAHLLIADGYAVPRKGNGDRL
jgi:hypothetical protein